MIRLSDANKKYIFTTKIEIDDEGNYVELREPTQKEISGMTEDGMKNLELLGKIFPDCLIGSSIVDDDGQSAKAADVYNLLSKSGSMFPEILTTWLQSIPFQHRLMKNGKSDK